MLPGFRFLFAAIMLSMSFLVFGLGAAALLRAAHESFASNSSWRGSPEVAFAQPPETTLPMLATLRVEPVTEKPSASAPAAAIPAELAASAIAAVRPEPAPTAAEPVKADQVTAARPADAPAEVTKPNSALVDMPVTQDPPGPEATSGEPVTAEPSNQTKTAAVETSSASEPAAVQAEPGPATVTPPLAPPAPMASAVRATLAEPAASAAPATSVAPATSAETSEAETKIATLGGPPVEIIDADTALQTSRVMLPRARPDESLIKKRLQARRARRRRLAARARLLLAQQQLLQANPFAQQPLAQPQQPYLQPAVTTRQRQ